MDKLKVCSLFSGVGGFEEGIYKALGRDNVEVVFSSEIDKFATQSYEIMHGHKPHGDITKVDAKDVPDHDLLVAGFPCQAFSIAGKREGFGDKTRGTLFFEVARLLQEKKPKNFILENVKGLVNHDKGKTLQTILETLEELNYTFHYKVLNSKHFGLAQNRERIFIVGEYNNPNFVYDFPENKEVHARIKDILESDVEAKFYLSEEQTNKFKPYEKKRKTDINITARAEQGRYEKERRTANQVYDDKGVAPTVKCAEAGQIHVLGNTSNTGYNKSNVLSTEGISSTIAARDYKGANQIAVVGNTSTSGHKSRDVHLAEGLAPTICAHDRFTPKQIVVEGNLDIKGHNALKRVFNPEGLAPTIDTMQGGNRQPKIIVEGNISETSHNSGQVLNAEGLSHTLLATTGIGKPKILEPNIDCINPRKEDGTQTYQQDRIYKEDGITPALCSTLSALRVAELPFRIRKLTPLECLRLQGFPDAYYETLKERGLSNTQLYKMAGNAVSPPVIAALVQNLVIHKKEVSE